MRILKTKKNRRRLGFRQAFTLVELMVAMVLTIFVMVILTEAFAISIDTFSGLKAIGDMQGNLRAGANQLRFDLSQDHFEGKRRTSDFEMLTRPPVEGFLAIENAGVFTQNCTTAPPSQNVTVVSTANMYVGMGVQAAGTIPPSTWITAINNATSITISSTPIVAAANVPLSFFATHEGLDSDSVASLRSNTYRLRMSCRLRGNQQQSFFTTQILDPVKPPVPSPNNNIQFFNLMTFPNMDPATQPGQDADATLRDSTPRPGYVGYTNTPINPAPNPNFPPNYPIGPYFYRSQWAEVAYFLMPQGTTEEPLNPSGTGTPLYGLYRVQFLAVTDNTQVNAAAFPSVPGGSFNQSYVGMASIDVGGNLRFLTPNDMAGAPGFPPVPAVRTISATNPGVQNPGVPALVVPNVLSFQVQSIVASGNAPNFPVDMNYDSATPNPNVLLQGVSITIRVWENKTRQVRQLTMVQDL